MLLFDEISNIDKLPKIKSEWNKLVLQSKENTVFQDYDFNKLWYNVYGKSFTLNVIRVRDSDTDETLAIIPFYIKKQNALRRIHFIGDSWFDYTMILSSVDPYLLAVELSKYLEERTGWDLIYMNSFIADSTTGKFVESLESEGFIVNRLQVATAPIINLKGSWESYFKSIKPKIKQDTNRQIIRLRELGNMQLNEITESEIGENLELFFQMYTARWKSIDKISKFDNMLNREFITLISKSAYKNKQIAFHRLMLDSKVLAFHLGFKDSRTFYYYIPVFNPDYVKYSVGRIMLMELIKLCSESGIRIFDMMAGEEKYKSDFSNESRSLDRAYIFRNNVKGRILNHLKSIKGN